MNYIPASSGVEAGPFGINESSKIKNAQFSITWWEENSMFHYNSMLVSAYYGISTPNYRDKYNIPRKGFTLYGDSGGFQVANVEGATMNPANLARWYNENVDKGFILDTPIVKKGIEFDNKMFDIALERTYKDTEIMLKYCNVPLYGILHGHNQMQLDKWWKRMSDFTFDAWCGGAKPPSDPMLQALMCMQLREFGIKKIHLLGVSGFSVVPVLAYASNFFDALTYDSGSYGVGAIYKDYILPQTNSKIQFARDTKNRLKTLPCECEVCRNVNAEQLYSEDSLSGALISLHNLIIYIKYNFMMNSLSSSKEHLKTFVEKNYKTTVLNAINFIDYTIENGLEKSYKKFFENSNTQQRVSLFG